MLELAHMEEGEDRALPFLPLRSVTSPKGLETAMMGKPTPQKIGQSPRASHFPQRASCSTLTIIALEIMSIYLMRVFFSTIRNNSHKY